MYGITELITSTQDIILSHQMCDFKCLNCGATFKKEFRYRNKKHACSSVKEINGVSYKKCYKCNQWLMESIHFFKNKEKSGKCCKVCAATYWRRYETRRKGREIKKVDKFGMTKRKLDSYLRNAVHRAIKHNLNINLTREYIYKLWDFQQGVCLITGHEFELFKGFLTPFSPSLDRLNPNEGYVMGNVAFVTYGVNSFKQKMSLIDFINMAKNIKWPNGIEILNSLRLLSLDEFKK